MAMTRRPPARRPVTPAEPAVRVPPRPATHWRDSMVVAGCGVAAFGAAPLVAADHLAVPALVAAAFAGMGTGVVGERTHQRRKLEDRLLEALAPLLRIRQLDRRVLRTSRWKGGWLGAPIRIQLQYAPAAPADDPLWVSEVLAVVEANLLAPYVVRQHRRAKGLLELRRATNADLEVDEPPYSQVRCERAIKELMGPTAKTIDAELDGDTLSAITVTHEAGPKLAASGYRNRIERTISTMMPGRWRARWDLENDTVRFEIRPTLPQSVWLQPTPLDDPDEVLKNYRNAWIPLAIDEDGEVIKWRPAIVPQALVIGGTGTGKTSTGHGMLGEITRRAWPVWVVDGKRVEFLAFRDWPNVQIIAGAVTQQVAVIHRAWELMEYRYQLIEDGLATVNDFEPLFVFVDEYTDFRANLLAWYQRIKVKGDPTKPVTFEQVASLARKGRTARIHLVVFTQRPDAEFLGGEMRDNFGFRVSMGRLSPQGAMMMWENPATGVSLPRDRTGRAIATNAEGRAVEVQCYRFPDMDAEEGSEEYTLLQQIRPPRAKWPRLVIVPPEPNDEGTPPTFTDYLGAEFALASERHDLDPLAFDPDQERPDGRELASAMASLGITTPDGGGRRVRHPDLTGLDTPDGDGPLTAAGYTPEAQDDYLGYGEPVHCSPRDLMVGDLIEVDEGSGSWAVIDEMPDDDLAAPGCVALSWRGDGDESGSLSVSDDERLLVRRPEEDL